MVESPESHDPVVLIVDDEPDLASLYRSYIESACRVRVAHTGDEALDLIDANLDIAFLDRDLPKWSGDELVDAIRERDVDCGIVMVTARDPDLDIVDLPVDDYLTKPILPGDLQGAVEEILYRLVGGTDRQELLALVSRKIALERQFSEERLHDEREYAKLNRRISLAEDRLGLRTVAQSSKYRPEVCPRCDLRWDVFVDGTVGYVSIGSRVWKCTRCGHVEKVPDPSNQFVAR